MNKATLLILAAIMFVATYSQTNEIDVVTKLLADLKGSAQAELNQITDDFHEAYHLKTTIIDSITLALQQQRGECNSRDRDVNDRNDDIEKTQNYIEWLIKRLDENDKRVKLLENNRCDGNANYIEGLKNNKITLRLVLFLKAAVQAADEKTLSLAQKNKMANLIVQFLTMSKDAKEAELIQLAASISQQLGVDWNVRSRTAEETGTGHVDNSRGEMKVAQGPKVDQQKFNNVKEELLYLLDSIEQELRAAIAKHQDLEIKAGLNLASFKVAITGENTQLNQELESEKRNLQDLLNQLTTCKQASSTCKSRLGQLQSALNLATMELDSATNLFNSQRKRFEEELILFDEVYRIYASRVATSDSQFKGRVQDYVDNKKFEASADYTNRSANQFGGLKGSVAESVRSQAARAVE